MAPLPLLALQPTWLGTGRGKGDPPPTELDDLDDDAKHEILDRFCEMRKMSRTAKPYRALQAPMWALVLKLHAGPWNVSKDELCLRPQPPGSPNKPHKLDVRFMRHNRSDWIDPYNVRMRIPTELTRENIKDLADVNLKYGAMSHIREVHFVSLQFERGEQDAWNALAYAFQKGFLVKLSTLALQSVDLSEGRCESLAKAFAASALPNLEVLQLNGTGIGKVGCESLADAFRQNALPHLEMLSLKFDNIGPLGGKALADVMREQKLEGVHMLLLTSCKLGPEGCMALAAALEYNVLPALNFVDLSGNAIGNEGCKALANAFEKQARPMLDYLSLNDNLIGDPAVPHLNSLMQSISTMPSTGLPAVIALGRNLFSPAGKDAVKAANSDYVRAALD